MSIPRSMEPAGRSSPTLFCNVTTSLCSHSCIIEASSISWKGTSAVEVMKFCWIMAGSMKHRTKYSIQRPCHPPWLLKPIAGTVTSPQPNIPIVSYLCEEWMEDWYSIAENLAEWWDEHKHCKALPRDLQSHSDRYFKRNPSWLCTCSNDNKVLERQQRISEDPKEKHHVRSTWYRQVARETWSFTVRS